jgi:tRNA(Ile)-lysidine synthase
MSLLERFGAEAEALGRRGRKALVAVSGGPDSVALLDLLVGSEPVHRLELIVAHLDHGIHPDSTEIAQRVRGLASRYDLPCEVGRLELGPAAGETEARARRYAWLEAARLRLGGDMIVTAHHADDQVETVLMRVLAGSGPAGLAGMAPFTGSVVRPLLRFRRKELAEYLMKQGLSAWADPANADGRHLRSWIRAEVLPQLRNRLPEVERHLLRLAGQAATNRQAWDSVLEILPGIDLHHQGAAISVAATALAGYDSRLAEVLICTLARRIGCRIGPARVGRVRELLASESSGAQVPLGSGFFAELSFGRLRLAGSEPQGEIQPWVLAGARGEGTWGRWRFRWESVSAPSEQDRTGLHAWFTPEPLAVRSWRPGERVRPLGGSGRRLLVRCFQEVQVPKSLRSSWPVLVRNDDILWIPGVCRSDTHIPTGGTEALRVDAEYA